MQDEDLKLLGDDEPAAAPADQDPDSLADIVQKHASAGNPDRPPVPTESKELINRMNQLAANYEHAPEQSKKSLADAMNKAEELYTSQANRNEWAEVAQMLGRAGAQFAAGMHGQATNGRTDMSNLGFAPPIDYEKRTERAAGDLRTRISAAGDMAKADQEAQKNAYNHEMAPLEYGFKGAENAAERRVQERRAGIAEAGANRRADISEQGIREQGERQRTGLSAQSIRDEMKDTHREMENALSGIPAVADELEGDLSSKELAAIKLKHPKEIGSLSPEDIKAAKDAASTPGRFYGTNFDREKFQENLNKAVQQKYSARLTNLKQSMDQLLGPSTSAAPAPAPKAPENKSLSQADLQKYAAQYKISTQDAQKALESYGYTIH